MQSYSEQEYLRIFHFQNTLLLNKLVLENNLSLLPILSKQILISLAGFDLNENYFKKQFKFEFIEKYESLRKEICNDSENSIYLKVPVFVIYELNNIIQLMNTNDYTFDDKPEDIQRIINGLKNDNPKEAAESFNRTDQYTRSYFSDSFILYFKYILSK